MIQLEVRLNALTGWTPPATTDRVLAWPSDGSVQSEGALGHYFAPDQAPGEAIRSWSLVHSIGMGRSSAARD